jgi:hypothetical protein
MSQTDLQQAAAEPPVNYSPAKMPTSGIEDAGHDSAVLELQVAEARSAMEAAVGYPLEIHGFEPVQADGEWKLRVFWRRAGSSELP